MAKKIIGLVKRTFIPSSPEDSPRTAVNWLIAFAPFVLVALYQRAWSFEFWAWMACSAMWTWNLTYAFVNRMYWRLFKQQNESMLGFAKDLHVEYLLLHDHCPQCGLRLKPVVTPETVQ